MVYKNGHEDRQSTPIFMFIYKPFRTYISNQALYRMKKSINENKTNMTPHQKVQSAISRIWLMKKYKSYNIIKELFF